MEWTVLEIKKRALVLVLLAVEIHHSKVGKVCCSHQHELLLPLPSTLTTSSVSQSRNELRLNAPSFWPSWLNLEAYSSLLEHQFCSVTQSFPTLCDPMDCSMPGLPIHHQHLELAQFYVHWVGDAIQPYHHMSPFSCLQFFPASESFPISQFFTSGGQSIGVSASSLVLPMNIQDWFPVGQTGWISLQSEGTLKSLLQHHSSKASNLRCSAFFIVQL